MERIIIGNSNIRRFYPIRGQARSPTYSVSATSSQSSFEAKLESVPNSSYVIVSVLENIIEQELQKSQDGAELGHVNCVLKWFIDVITMEAEKRPNSRFALAYPILRPANKWMKENYDAIKRSFENAYNSQSLINITKVDAVSFGSQSFELDNVHLTKAAGENFVTNLIVRGILQG